MAQPSHVQLKKGKHYTAQFSLPGLYQYATNEDVRKELENFGFIMVEVKGKGNKREATGTWPKEDQQVEKPAQVTALYEAIPSLL
ncbi:MAG: hypothetical protein ACK5OS_01690 [Chryseotalea sp.]|jgi:hypothetical protein